MSKQAKIRDAFEIATLTALQDNFVYAIIHKQSKRFCVVDPSESNVVLEFADRNHLNLTEIWNTHHHHDHVGGNLDLQRKFGCKIRCSSYDKNRVPGADVSLDEHDEFHFEGLAIQVISTPGHTLGAICFYIPTLEALFTGDTLFAAGCGRLFEGTAEQMHASLQKIRKLPAKTRIFCGHEYTLKNLAFCKNVLESNQSIINRIEKEKSKIRTHGHTMPSTLETEVATNPFLSSADWHEFSRLRSKKDQF